jgi:fructose-1,6-bisphosphatase/inositol monophosphatase family enzyme
LQLAAKRKWMINIFKKIFLVTRKAIIAGMSSARTGINAKGDITKYFDKHTENLIISELKQTVRFRAQIISEELKKPLFINSDVKTGMYSIIIDPVDGSDNYLAGTHFVAVAIAVFDEKLRPVYSFAGNYYTGDYVYADKKALYFNGRKIRKPFIKPPKELLLLAVTDTRPKKPAEFMSLVNEFDIIRSFGATAGELLYVVKGEAKAFVDIRGKLTLENFAPFFLIAKHAGLKMTDEKGKDMKLTSLSMTKGYKIIFSQPAYLRKIIRHTASI